MYIRRYWGYLDVQVLVVCLSLMTFLILKLFSKGQFDCSDLYNIKGANLAFSNLCAILNHCVPLQKIKINYKNKNPWINKEI